MSECTCGKKFRDAEDYRDHLPCEGTKEQQEISRLRKEVTRLRDGLSVIQDEADCHEDPGIVEMAKNILAGKDPFHYNGD